jgi:hypothetical protein
LTCNVKLFKIKNVVYKKGFPEQDIEKNKLFKNCKNGLLILDDLMEECGRSPTLANLFTKVKINSYYFLINLFFLFFFVLDCSSS